VTAIVQEYVGAAHEYRRKWDGDHGGQRMGIEGKEAPKNRTIKASKGKNDLKPNEAYFSLPKQ